MDINLTNGEVWNCTGSAWVDSGSTLKGTNGTNGSNGSNGSNGTSIHTSSGSPTGSCSTGDVDINLTNGEVWNCTGSAWVDSTKSLQGPAGQNYTLNAPNSSNSTSTGCTTTSSTYSATLSGSSCGSVSVTLTTGTRVMVIVTCTIDSGNAGNPGYASYAISGATTQAASDANAVLVEGAGGKEVIVQSSTTSYATVTAGSNVFTLEFRTAASGTGTFDARSITVIPLN